MNELKSKDSILISLGVWWYFDNFFLFMYWFLKSVNYRSVNNIFFFFTVANIFD